ncbi:hypothetical protein PIB30_017685 [Stylosanthes scabra]|uniref:Tetratricopeptide repeat protein n=1 Tax=Stylosanthes scabra TaxID=79078 RepID=A0ABU6Z814_9FABA|nr:hypothetical protein [Stylosanthes scabra]
MNREETSPAFVTRFLLKCVHIHNPYKATLSVTTGLSAPYNNLAIIYKQQGSYADPYLATMKSYALIPWQLMGFGHVEASIKSYRQALILRQDFPEATCNLLHTLQGCGMGFARDTTNPKPPFFSKEGIICWGSFATVFPRVAKPKKQ